MKKTNNREIFREIDMILAIRDTKGLPLLINLAKQYPENFRKYIETECLEIERHSNRIKMLSLANSCVVIKNKK